MVLDCFILNWYWEKECTYPLTLKSILHQKYQFVQSLMCIYPFIMPSQCTIHSVQQLEDWQVATRRYDSRAQDVGHWLGNMEGKLSKLDLEVQDIHAVDLQIQQLKASRQNTFFFGY